ncbi:TetR family transcriptional regulator [Streptomyces sp. CA-111067]|uniref:acyl-CoA-like ligand-binding transcription factor n=1 Tax=Streptomyces sp. CA-111067 TaxID=3240046 RepID=UPI003D9715DF
MSSEQTPAPRPVPHAQHAAPAAAASTCGVRSAGSKVLSLRERKKQRTRVALRKEAYRLFAEQGYEATTVDQIAAAADVSPSTFFRYYPTKEDVVLTDEYDPALSDALRARPPGEPLIAGIRHSLAESLGRLLTADREDLMLRTRLSFEDPDIRARSMDEVLRSEAAIAEIVAERTGRAADDLEVRCAAAAIIAVSSAIVRHWVEGDGKEDLLGLYDRHLRLLEDGIRL